MPYGRHNDIALNDFQNAKMLNSNHQFLNKQKLYRTDGIMIELGPTFKTQKR